MSYKGNLPQINDVKQSHSGLLDAERQVSITELVAAEMKIGAKADRFESGDSSEENLLAEPSAQLKSAFLRNVKHEFRSALNTIIGYAELLEDAFPPGDEQTHAWLCSIARASARLDRYLRAVIEPIGDGGRHFCGFSGDAPAFSINRTSII